MSVGGAVTRPAIYEITGKSSVADMITLAGGLLPVEIDKIRSLAFWGSVTQILYQGATAVAAVKTFSI